MIRITTRLKKTPITPSLGTDYGWDKPIVYFSKAQ